MKPLHTYPAFSFIILLILASSCVSYESSVKKINNLEYGAVRVDTEWKTKRTGKWIFPVLGAAAGTAYGYNAELIKGIENQNQNTLAWGATGVLGGALIGNMILGGRREGVRNVKPSENQKWLRKYNKDTGHEYILHQVEDNNDLILIPETLQDDIERIKNEYNMIASTLKSSNEVSWDQLTDYQQSLDNNYKDFLSEETDDLARLIAENEISAASYTLLTAAEAAAAKNNTYATIQELLRFEEQNRILYAKADRQAIAQSNAMIQEKITAALAAILPAEINKVGQIREDQNGLKQVNDFYSKFDQSYGKLATDPSVQEVYARLRQKKTAIVTQMMSPILSQIDHAATIDQLEDISARYLSHVEPQNTSISALEDRLSTRKNDLLEAQRRKALARREAERLRNEKFERETSERNHLIAHLTERVKEWRSELRIKYESNLPTFEDLNHIMNLASAIGDRAYWSDQDKFIAYVERMGYMLDDEHRELYSDINNFLNSKGFEIKTVRIDDDFGRQKSISARFIVKNAPKDIIDLYVVELTSQYREMKKSTIVPKTLKSITDYRSPWYVKSGSTLYGLEIKNGDLTVKAFDNADAIRPVFAERIGANTLKVTPWSNSTDIYLNEGDVIHFEASGSIRLGVFTGFFVGDSHPNGIVGLKNFNVDDRFRHGSLMGKIGKGDWFYIGTNRTITAENSGILLLRINDDKENDNDGFYTVNYSYQ